AQENLEAGMGKEIGLGEEPGEILPASRSVCIRVGSGRVEGVHPVFPEDVGQIDPGGDERDGRSEVARPLERPADPLAGGDVRVREEFAVPALPGKEARVVDVELLVQGEDLGGKVAPERVLELNARSPLETALLVVREGRALGDGRIEMVAADEEARIVPRV